MLKARQLKAPTRTRDFDGALPRGRARTAEAGQHACTVPVT
jgi:hypothetical protein